MVANNKINAGFFGITNQVNRLDTAIQGNDQSKAISDGQVDPGLAHAVAFTVPVGDFDKLAKSGPTSKLLDGAPRASGRRSSAGGEEINYATLEHAGRPHRGRISPEEAAFVREHLPEVNERLRAEGKRLIDPTNQEHKEQYGL